MVVAEDNPNNPSIASKGSINPTYYFIIKYRSESERIYLSTLVMKMIDNHEIKDFHVEEKKAFVESRILFNMKTLSTNSEVTYQELESEFVKRLREL